MSKEKTPEQILIDTIRNNRDSLKDKHIKELPFTSFNHDPDIVDFIKDKIKNSDLEFFLPKNYPASKTRFGAMLYLASENFLDLPDRGSAPSGWIDSIKNKGKYVEQFCKKITEKEIDFIGYDHILKLNRTLNINEVNYEPLAMYAYKNDLIDKRYDGKYNFPYYHEIKKINIEELLDNGYEDYLLNHAIHYAGQDIDCLRRLANHIDIDVIINRVGSEIDYRNDKRNQPSDHFVNGLLDLTVEKMKNKSLHDQTCYILTLVGSFGNTIDMERLANSVDPSILTEVKNQFIDELIEPQKLKLEEKYLKNELSFF